MFDLDAFSCLDDITVIEIVNLNIFYSDITKHLMSRVFVPIPINRSITNEILRKRSFVGASTIALPGSGTILTCESR